MKTKELRQLLKENRNIQLTIGNWVLRRCKDSLGGDTIYVKNIYRVEDAFDSQYDGDMIKLFMQKVAYLKRRGCTHVEVITSEENIYPKNY